MMLHSDSARQARLMLLHCAFSVLCCAVLCTALVMAVDAAQSGFCFPVEAASTAVAPMQVHILGQQATVWRVNALLSSKLSSIAKYPNAS